MGMKRSAYATHLGSSSHTARVCGNAGPCLRTSCPPTRCVVRCRPPPAGGGRWARLVWRAPHAPGPPGRARGGCWRGAGLAGGTGRHSLRRWRQRSVAAVPGVTRRPLQPPDGGGHTQTAAERVGVASLQTGRTAQGRAQASRQETDADADAVRQEDGGALSTRCGAQRAGRRQARRRQARRRQARRKKTQLLAAVDGGNLMRLTHAGTPLRLCDANHAQMAALDALAAASLRLCQAYTTAFCSEAPPDTYAAPCCASPRSPRAGSAWRSSRLPASPSPGAPITPRPLRSIGISWPRTRSTPKARATRRTGRTGTRQRAGAQRAGDAGQCQRGAAPTRRG
jgi:hypothetical protein